MINLQIGNRRIDTQRERDPRDLETKVSLVRSDRKSTAEDALENRQENEF